MNLIWKNKGIKEIAIDKDSNIIITVNKKYFRPLDVDYLKGNASKAKKNLNWEPKISLEQGIALAYQDFLSKEV